MMRGRSNRKAADEVVGIAWNELKSNPFIARQLGESLPGIPDLSIEKTFRRAAVGRDILHRISSINQAELPLGLALDLKLLTFRANAWMSEPELYWYAVNPLGIAWGLFHPTAYCGNYLFKFSHEQIRDASRGKSEDKIIDLLRGYGEMLRQMAHRLSGQLERGIVMPRPQTRRTLDLLSQYKQGFEANIDPSIMRWQDQNVSMQLHEIDDGFVRLNDCITRHQLSSADEVGMCRMPGGSEIYERLVSYHTTLPLGAPEIHRIGLERATAIQSEMEAIASERGFGNCKDFERSLERDPRWRASTEAEIERFFVEPLEKLIPRLEDAFESLPAAGFEIKPIELAARKSMTFGYYEAPTPNSKVGTYWYNPDHLCGQPLHTIAGLAYHEILPGHHLHRASERENERLSNVRRYSFVTAFSEGWAEYASALATELGLYSEEQRYGRLSLDALLTCRLVVDTGLNALNWTFEQAETFLRTYTSLSDAEISSELLRYGADIPGQALAYKLGDALIFSLREKVKQTQGNKFSLKKFHSAVLYHGAIPLPDLEWHVTKVLGI